MITIPIAGLYCSAGNYPQSNTQAKSATLEVKVNSEGRGIQCVCQNLVEKRKKRALGEHNNNPDGCLPAVSDKQTETFKKLEFADKANI